MWHKANGVAARGPRGPAARPALARSGVPRRARVAAIVVSVAATWLILSGVRFLFDPGLEVLPSDGDLFAHLYGGRDRRPSGSAISGIRGGSVSWHLTEGERFQSRMLGVFFLFKALQEFIVTFGGADPRTFKLLALLNGMLVWASATAVPALSISANSGFLLMCLSAVEVPALWILAGTNGVYEPDEEGHEH